MPNKDKVEEWYNYAKQLEYENHLMKANIISLETKLSAADSLNDQQYDWRLWYQEKLQLIHAHVRNPITYPFEISDSKDKAMKKYVEDEDNWYERLRDIVESEGDS